LGYPPSPSFFAKATKDLASAGQGVGIAPAPNYGKSLFRAGQAGFIKPGRQKLLGFAFALNLI